MLDLIGRGERIRTSDLTVPNRALYQAEPRPDILCQRPVDMYAKGLLIIGKGVSRVKFRGREAPK